jgi:hypothetical protein
MLKKFLLCTATGLALLVAAGFAGSGAAVGAEPASTDRGARANAPDGDQGQQTAQDGKKKKGKKGSYKKGKKGKKGKGKKGGSRRGKGKGKGKGKGQKQDTTEEVRLTAPALQFAFDTGARLEASLPATADRRSGCVTATLVRQRHFGRALAQPSGVLRA